MRLIDADALKEDIMQSCLFAKEWDYALVEQAIDAQFTIKPLLCDDGNGVKIMDSETLAEIAEIVEHAYYSGYEEGKAETIDAVPVVRCKDCKHRPIDTGGKGYGADLSFDDDYKCPCRCEDQFYSWMPFDDWFCANGERRDIKHTESISLISAEPKHGERSEDVSTDM